MLRDEPPHAWHVAEVTLLAGDGLTRFDVGARAAERVARAPRLRQRPGTTIAGELWTDVADFDVTRHVHQLRVPAASPVAVLQDKVAELLREPLTRRGPRWDVGVVAHLQGKRSALVTRVHPGWVDGEHPHPLAVLLDESPVATPPVPAAWTPEPPPSEPQGLVAAVKHPSGLLSAVGTTLTRWGAAGARMLRREEDAPVVRHAAGTGLPLEAVQRLARARGDRVHDVLLALVAGGFRRVGESRDVVANVPQAVVSADGGQLGFAVEARTVVLPVGSADGLDRLEDLASLTQAAVDTGRLVPAARMTGLPGFAAAALHALAARRGAETGTEVLVSSVPGPPSPRFLGEREVRATYPILGLTGPQRLSVGFTSYAGQVYVGLCGTAPVEPLAAAMLDELQDLLRRTEV